MKIGIDLGGSHIAVGVIENNKIIYKLEKDLYEKEKGPENKISLIINIVNALIKQNNVEREDVEIIGIACPGIVENEIVRKAKNLAIDQIDFKKELEKEYKGIKISVKNDAKAAALAEKEYGVLHSYSNCIMLTMGTGIGGAVFHNGQLLQGKTSAAFEVGHMIIHKNGKLCSCNSKGCFESYGAIKNLRKQVEEQIKQEITGVELVEILNSANKTKEIEEILEEYIDNLAIGIANLSNIFEPEAIALGGSIVYYKDIILERLNYKLENEEYIFNKNNIPTILMAKLNNDAGMIGATIE